ncbi:pyridoxamine 5'-phosphate oxidase family protein [Bacillus sp. FJAT-53711]|uniref:Pyridoxamine 5'-phosphate oxidase family protein n=1 Tax=Bacillus yunxiaonensis TaxID=3127665 RepID=A0ABU8FZC8_9BACI
MANIVEPTLTAILMQALREERIVTIATTDFEKGVPNVNAISWVYAMDEKSIRFAVDQRSRIVENLRHHAGLVLTVMANESVYSISGEAIIKVERMEGVPLKLTLIEVSVQEVRDVMFYGAKLAIEPKYEKTYDLRAAAKLDNQVLSAMKDV